jgi:hypothetical protein
LIAQQITEVLDGTWFISGSIIPFVGLVFDMIQLEDIPIFLYEFKL